VALSTIYYIFVRIDKTPRVIPAMAAGVPPTEHFDLNQN
jgi:hypothetical protein